MSKLVDEIRKALKPHHVEGFTAICFPMPTLQQMEQLIAEVERLTDASKTNESLLADALEEIDRLRAERDRYKAALIEIRDFRIKSALITTWTDAFERLVRIAAEAVRP